MMNSLYLKRSMLDWNFCSTFLVTVFGIVAIFITANVFEDASELTPILDFKGHHLMIRGKGLYRMNAVPQNTKKVTLMIVHEIILYLCVVAVCIVMRPRERYPSYFDSELSETPHIHGVRAFDGDGLF